MAGSQGPGGGGWVGSSGPRQSPCSHMQFPGDRNDDNKKSCEHMQFRASELPRVRLSWGSYLHTDGLRAKLGGGLLSSRTQTPVSQGIPRQHSLRALCPFWLASRSSCHFSLLAPLRVC